VATDETDSFFLGHSQYRALKFRQAKTSGLGMERAVLQKLTTSASTHPGRDLVVRLYDVFEVCGPNGKHDVFVMEVTGPTVEEMRSCAYYPGSESPFRLPPTLIRHWSRQLLLALDYLATEGVVHGNERPFALNFLEHAAPTAVEEVFLTGTAASRSAYEQPDDRCDVPRRTF
jgi:hypothetical protein